MSAYTAELIGTMMLVLLGNGVVANVVLARTNGNNAGWIVITAGWGYWCFRRRFLRERVQWCAPEPSG